MKSKNQNRREAPISYRPPASLKDEFELRVRKSGLSISAYITQSVFGKSMPRQVRRAPIEKQLLAKQLAILADIRDQLGRFEEEKTNEEEIAPLLAEVTGILTDLRNSFLKSMGRKP